MAHIFKDNDLRVIYEAMLNVNSNQNPITVTIDITDKTVINMTGNEYADIVILTSNNDRESIETITNAFSNKEITFFPANGLAVEFKNKTAGETNIKLFAETQTANGTKSGFIKLKRRAIESVVDFFEMNFIDEYF